MPSSLSSAGFLGLQAIERVDLDVLDEGVELILGVLVFVSLAGNSDTHLTGHIADTVDPDEAVEAGVDSDVFSVHLFGGEALDVADAARCTLLELDAVEHFVDVDCVVTAGRLHFSLDHVFLLITKYNGYLRKVR